MTPIVSVGTKGSYTFTLMAHMGCDRQGCGWCRRRTDVGDDTHLLVPFGSAHRSYVCAEEGSWGRGACGAGGAWRSLRWAQVKIT